MATARRTTPAPRKPRRPRDYQDGSRVRIRMYGAGAPETDPARNAYSGHLGTVVKHVQGIGPTVYLEVKLDQDPYQFHGPNAVGPLCLASELEAAN